MTIEEQSFINHFNNQFVVWGGTFFFLMVEKCNNNDVRYYDKTFLAFNFFDENFKVNRQVWLIDDGFELFKKLVKVIL